MWKHVEKNPVKFQSSYGALENEFITLSNITNKIQRAAVEIEDED